MCPECGSDNMQIIQYDFGRCPETGYHEAGERYECHDCGSDGDADCLLVPDQDDAECNFISVGFSEPLAGGG